MLSACAVGDVDPNAAGGGLNLASVLLLRGAAQVVAPTVPVSDAAAAAYSQALYANLGELGELAATARGHRAGLAAARAVPRAVPRPAEVGGASGSASGSASDPDPAWTAFRRWTR